MYKKSHSVYEEKKRYLEEKYQRLQEISLYLLNEKFDIINNMKKRVKRVRKSRCQGKKPDPNKGVVFPESPSDSSDEEDEYRRIFEELDRQSAATRNRSSPETSFRGSKLSQMEKMEKFFNEFLVDLSSKAHFNNLAANYEYTIYSKEEELDTTKSFANFKVSEPQFANTINQSLNSLLKVALEKKRKEVDRFISEEKRQEKEKARREQEALELEERRKAEQKQRIAEEEVRIARKEIEEFEMKKKREEEVIKQAEEQRVQRLEAQRQQQLQLQLQQQKQLQLQQQKEQTQPLKNQEVPSDNTQNQGLDDTVIAEGTEEERQQPSSTNNILNEVTDDEAFVRSVMGNVNLSQAEAQAIGRMKNTINLIKNEILARGLAPETTVFIVTVSNIPPTWNTDIAKQKFTQIDRKFDNLKVQMMNNVSTALMRITGFQNTIRTLVLRDQNIEGSTLRVDYKFSENQNRGQTEQTGQGVQQMGQNNIMQNPTQNQITTGGTGGGQMSLRAIRNIVAPKTISQAQPGQNMFQTSQTNQMTTTNQSYPSPDQSLKPKFGQASHIQSPSFGQTSGFGQGMQRGMNGMGVMSGVSNAHSSPNLQRQPFGFQAGPQPSYGQNMNMMGGMGQGQGQGFQGNNMQGMSSGSFGGFGGSNSSFMGFQGKFSVGLSL